MKKQMTGVDMARFVILAMVALIALYAAGQSLTLNLSSIARGAQIVTSVAGKEAAAPAASTNGADEALLYRAVMANPGTGAAKIEWSAPRGSAANGTAQYQTEIVNPGTGAAVAEWSASPEAGVIDGQGLALYRQTAGDGAEIVVWRSPQAR